MDSEDDELSLDALLKIQQEALAAKRVADELARERKRAKTTLNRNLQRKKTLPLKQWKLL